MNRTHNNSLAAYRSVMDQLSPMRAKVVRTLAEVQPATRETVAMYAKMPDNTARPRVRELMDCGLIIEDGHKVVEGRKHALLRLAPPGNYKPPRKRKSRADLEAENTRYRETLDAIEAVPNRYGNRVVALMHRIAKEALSGQ